MNKNMIYREQILYFLNRNEDYNAMMEWLEEQPDLDQPDIMREMTAILKERHEKTGEMEWLEKATIIEKGIDRFEEEILDKKLYKALFIMHVEGIDFDPEKVQLFLINAREAITKSFLSSSENAKELWELAHKLIKAEKREGLYNPTNWSSIFPL